MTNDGFPNTARICDATAPLYYFHVPKTAGTSFNQYPESKLIPSDVWPIHLWSQFFMQPPDSVAFSLAGKRLIWGHFYAYFARFHPAPLRYITFLRDPIERALSHYGHVILHPSHELTAVHRVG